MRSRGGLASSVALAVMVLVACTSTTAGSPSSARLPGSDPSSQGSPSGVELPPRPREITLDGADPCTLWTGDQLASLGMAPAFRRNTTTAGDPLCAYDASDRRPPRISLNVALVLDHDAAELLSPDRGDQVVTVAGFPAVQQTFPAAGPRPCVVIVGTARGQSLDVTLNYGSTEGHLSGEQACALTVRAATFALQTLQTQR